jgi:hypothetical protein
MRILKKNPLGGARGCPVRVCECRCGDCYGVTNYDDLVTTHGNARHCCRHKRNCHKMCYA